VLDNRYPAMRNPTPDVEQIITVYDTLENALVDLMTDFVQRYHDVRFSSLPHIGEGDERKLELGVKGEKSRVDEAMAWLKNGVEALGLKWQNKLN
jgi:molybdopterin-biosynthesis enzyme MoeA-like protein